MDTAKSHIVRGAWQAGGSGKSHVFAEFLPVEERCVLVRLLTDWMRLMYIKEVIPRDSKPFLLNDSFIQTPPSGKH